MAMTPKKGASKRKVGRPTLYRPEFVEIASRHYQVGATDIEVADALRISASTLYSWQHAYPAFLEAARVAKEAADERVERSLYHRAVGYSYPAVKIMQEKGAPFAVRYTEHVPPDPNAASLWLRNRKPNEWRDNRSIMGANGGNFIVECITRLVRPDGPMPAAK